jgi:hypothetical protein
VIVFLEILATILRFLLWHTICHGEQLKISFNWNTPKYSNDSVDDDNPMQKVFANLLSCNVNHVLSIFDSSNFFFTLSCQFLQEVLRGIRSHVHSNCFLSLLQSNSHLTRPLIGCKYSSFTKEVLTFRGLTLWLLSCGNSGIFVLLSIRSVDISLKNDNNDDYNQHNGHLRLENIICFSCSFK